MSDNPLQIYRSGNVSTPDSEPLRLANATPPWRKFGSKQDEDGAFRGRSMSLRQESRGKTFQPTQAEARIVDAAIVLRRPLLIEGDPGIGKTSLAYSVAWQLGLGDVLKWPITSRSTLKDALYRYDAIARLQDASISEKAGDEKSAGDIGKYMSLGPLGSALVPNRTGPYQPRVLLIDEIDKSDLDLPNDLLHVLEEGSFEIPEIARLNRQSPVSVRIHESSTMFDLPADGKIECDDFPIIMMTTNGEREFSPAFLRRCMRLRMNRPDEAKLKNILGAHLGSMPDTDSARDVLAHFVGKLNSGDQLAVDQLLNAIYLTQSTNDVSPEKHQEIKQVVMQSLSDARELGT